jgi:hypothetical protein
LEPSPVDGGTGVDGEGFVQSDFQKGSHEQQQARQMAWGSIHRGLEAEEVELEAAWLIYVKQRFN